MSKELNLELIEKVNKTIAALSSEERALVSDGHHTFPELYDFRKMYHALVVNQWAQRSLYNCHKSMKHFDGEECFGGGWFIVVSELPTGQISNHYPVADWDLFKVPVTQNALVEFDGHEGKDVLDRLKTVIQSM